MNQIQQTNSKYLDSHISHQKLHQLWWQFQSILESEKLWVQAPNTPQLCKKLDTNQKYLSQTINQATGLTIVSYLHCYRIQQFIQKLRNNEAQLKTIEALIHEVGFQNRTSFYRSFKILYGIYPNQLIRQLSHKD